MEKIKVYTAQLDEEGELGVYAISFVDAPAIKKNFMHFKEQYLLQKVDEERRMVYGPAMIPDLPILRVTLEGEAFYIKFPKKVVEKMAHRFFEQNMHHNMTEDHEKPVKDSIVVESWLKEGDSDKSLALGFEAMEDGTWFVGSKVMNDELWNRVKAGEVLGFSIEIDADVKLEGEEPEDDIIEEMEKILNQE